MIKYSFYLNSNISTKIVLLILVLITKNKTYLVDLYIITKVL